MSVERSHMSAYACQLVDALHLEPHPEGGWYARDWQHERLEPASGRPLASLIYFLLPQGDASAWHKVDADEIWLWHGPSLLTLELGGTGDKPADTDQCTRYQLGTALTGESSEALDGVPVGHVLVPAGTWQRTIEAEGDVLVSCVVSPGFTFQGFTLDQE